jgi:hypothetical protein
MFPNHNIYKYIWTSPDGKTHNQIDPILINRQGHLSVLNVQSFRAADCDTDHYLAVAKVGERLAANKQRLHRCHMQRLNLKKLNEVAGKEEHRVEVSNRFPAMEDYIINSAWEIIREYIKHKPRFNDGCSKLLDQRKQAKLQ